MSNQSTTSQSNTNPPGASSQTSASRGAQSQNGLQNWQPRTLVDAYQNKPPIQYVVDGAIEIPSLNVVYGAPGCLKSFLLADMVGCVVGGQGWLPPLPGSTGKTYSVIQSPVVWLDFDNGKRRSDDRFAAIGRALGLPPDAPLYYYSVPDPWLDAGDKMQITELANIVLSHNARLVVMDNLGTISGKADENSADMVSILANLRWLSETTNSANTVIHHRRKASGQNARKGDALRGHSSIEAALDLALMVERDSNLPIVHITATKTRGADIPPFSAQFTYEQDSNGQLYKARFFGAQSQALVVVSQIRKAIWDSLDNGALNKGELTALAQVPLGGIGEKRVIDQIEMMCKDGYLLMKIGPNNAQIYSRNPQKPL